MNGPKAVSRLKTSRCCKLWMGSLTENPEESIFEGPLAALLDGNASRSLGGHHVAGSSPVCGAIYGTEPSYKGNVSTYLLT